MDSADIAGEVYINEEYKIWKKNTPFLYDLVVTKALEWPSLTCQWLPYKTKARSDDFSVQRLLLGTHTSDGEQNHLMILNAQIPSESMEGETDEGGFEQHTDGKIQVVQKINHDGEVNRARYMPQDPHIIATKTVKAEVLVFDTSKQPLVPSNDRKCRPQLRLRGHKKEGYGVSWSPRSRGRILSAGEDKLICMWDVGAASRGHDGGGGAVLNPLHVYEGHTDVVGDVEWHSAHRDMFASVGDDRRLCMWDARSRTVTSAVVAHRAEVNTVSFSQHMEFLLVTGSTDSTLKLWDYRKLNHAVHVFEAHVDEVVQVEWAPRRPGVFASASSDRRVRVWCLDKIGDAQDPEDAQDGPPELLFIHGGHTNKVSDLAWNPNEDWMLASVADDNMLQLWEMAEHVYEDLPAVPGIDTSAAAQARA